jgi:hypothetical protein
VIRGEYDILLIVEGGYLGTITDRSGEGKEFGEDTILEWYESPVTYDVMVQLKLALDGHLHELPPIMYNTCDTVRDIVETRLQGFVPENDFEGLVFDYLSNEMLAYYEDTPVPYDDPNNLSILFNKITGGTRAFEGVEDDELLKEFF